MRTVHTLLNAVQAMAVVSLFALTGCEDKNGPATPTAPAKGDMQKAAGEMRDAGAKAAEDAQKAASDAAANINAPD